MSRTSLLRLWQTPIVFLEPDRPGLKLPIICSRDITMLGYNRPFIVMRSLRWLVFGVACLGSSAAHAKETSEFGATFDEKSNISYPASPAVVDVTQAPYHARGDGQTDDTEALQRALFDVMGQHKLLYFPNGTYLVSKTLNWSKKNSAGRDAWGKNFIQGQNVAKTVIRLKDATFRDLKQPASIMWCGGLARRIGFTTTFRT